MALYSIEWKESAKKELKKLPKAFIVRILSSIEALSSHPIPKGCKKIQGSMFLYRIRVGNYRIVYSVENKILRIEIIRIKHRKDVYKKKFPHM